MLSFVTSHPGRKQTTGKLVQVYHPRRLTPTVLLPDVNTIIGNLAPTGTLGTVL